MKLVYVAAPYTGTAEESMTRVTACGTIVRRLIQRYPSYAFYAPTVHGHALETNPEANRRLIPPANYEYWINHGLRMIDAADEMWVLQIEGWETSKGIDIEMRYATKHRTPLFLVDPEDLKPGLPVEVQDARHT